MCGGDATGPSLLAAVSVKEGKPEGGVGFAAGNGGGLGGISTFMPNMPRYT